MTPRVLSFVFAVLILTAGGAQAAAQQTSTPADSDPARLLDSLFAPITEQLGLTREQRAQIEAIAAPEYARGGALLLRLTRVTAELDEEQSKETFDEDRVRALASQAGQTMAEMTVIKLRVKAKVTALLTPAQRVLVGEQLRTNRERDEGLPLY